MEDSHCANSITIPSLGRIDDPFGVLSEACKGLYDIYDGVPVGQENAIEVLDIVLTASLNSHLTSSRVSAIYQNRCGIEEALAHVPVQAALLDRDWHKEAVLDLLERVCEVEGAWLAVATKILHKKRPGLIPILDDRILRHYVYGKHRKGERWLKDRVASVGERASTDRVIAGDALDAFRDDLVAVRDALAALVRELAEQHGWQITLVRALDMLVWDALGDRQAKPTGLATVAIEPEPD